MSFKIFGVVISCVNDMVFLIFILCYGKLIFFSVGLILFIKFISVYLFCWFEKDICIKLLCLCMF